MPALVAHTGAGSSTSNNVTTSAIDTSGATLLIVCVNSYQSAAAPTLSDSKSNTWTGLTTYELTAGGRVKFYYCDSPTVGSGHTFTLTGTGDYPAIEVVAFSGTISPAFDVENGKPGGTGGSQPGSVTPSTSSSVIVTDVVIDATGSASSIDSGFTISDEVIYVGGQHFGAALAYKIVSTTSPENPTWTDPNTANEPINIAVFKGIPPTAIGTLTATQDDQTLSSSGNLPITGTLNESQADQTLTSSGSIPIVGGLTVTQDDESLSSAGAVGDTGVLVAAQAANSISSTAKLIVQGYLSIAQADETLSSTGHVPREPNAHNLTDGPTHADFWQIHDFPAWG